MFKKSVILVLLAFSINSFAHEGHDDVPGAIQANHGGTVKAGKEINLEYVVSEGEVKLFPVSHDGKGLASSEVKMAATGKTPKGKAEPIKFEIKDEAFVAKIDFKGAYRVEMNVTADHQGKVSTFKFQVEK